MDDDLNQLLVAIRLENAAAHAETRRQVEAAQVENATAHVETRRQVETAQVENAAAHVETRRLFEITAESLEHKLEIVAEQVLSNGQKIDRLDAKIDHIASDLDVRVTRLEAASSQQRGI